jgi:DNA-binding response OmpR family regulator
MQDNHPILLVEDDPEAADLLRIALKKAGLRRPLRVLSDGDEAVAYLSGEPPYDDREQHPTPCLILLDLKLPRKSGLEVLAWMRSNIDTRPIPAVMITSSAAEGDIEQALRLGIRAYCVKPADFEEMKKLARMIRRRADGETEDELEELPISRSRRRASRR